MEFCENCGKPLKVLAKNTSVIIASCDFCGTKKLRTFSELGYNEKPKKVEVGQGVLTDKHEGNGFPHICKKCNHDLADVHDLGAMYADESNIYLFKCKKCGYVERQSDGTGN